MRTQFVSPILIEDGFAYGWATRAGQRRVEVHLWMDGRHVATEFTGLELPGSCERHCGKPTEPGAAFMFALPAEALDGFAHDLHVGLPSSGGESLHGVVQTYEHSAVRGEVRQQGRQFVGTVWFKSRPARQARLEVADSAGRVLLRQALAFSRTPERHGFPAQFAIAGEALPDGPLHFSCRGQPLRGAPCSRRVSVLGLVERADAAGIRGWAFDGADPGRPLELCLRVDGRPMAWFRPNARRPEIASRLGQPQDAIGLIGFHLPLPEGLVDGRLHRIEVVCADDGESLTDGHRLVKIEPAWIEYCGGSARNTGSWIPDRVRDDRVNPGDWIPDRVRDDSHSVERPVIAGSTHDRQIVIAGSTHGRQIVIAGSTHDRQSVIAGSTHDRQIVIAGSTRNPAVSVVILNRNGEQVLSAFLESWARHNTVPAEVIVIDHASTDGSLQMLERWRKALDLKVVALDRNDSFSESSNRGARQACGEYLLFMNNDIVWLQDALPRMLESLQQPDVGVVGLKLLKTVGESQHALLPATEVQHLGVRFKLNDRGYWPYEAAPSTLRREAEYVPQVVPAVTGAVLLCRKSDFESAGGFDTDYFYGFEDVELCMRLSQRLRKLVVSRNDVCALHRHGHTRLSGREMSLYERVQRNSSVLERHLGLWLKQAYWRSLVQGDGYMTSERLTIGVVVDEAPLRKEATPLARDALALASQLQEALPHARIVFLPPERGWKTAADLHVLVVGTPAYDIRAIRNARADLLTVAWLRSDPERWSSLPWWLDFGGYSNDASATGLRVKPAMTAASRCHAGLDGACPGLDPGASTSASATGLRVKPAMTAASRCHAGLDPGASIGDLLSATRWRLRVAIHVPLPQSDLDGPAPLACQSRSLLAALKQSGLPCWRVPRDQWVSHPAMADVCITLHDGEAAHEWSTRADMLNVLWLTDPAVRSPRHWKPSHGRVTREAPTVEWLQQAMEESIGNTFRPS
jgi:GT2 family glycosyltransferase